jgi:hypothetical protein
MIAAEENVWMLPAGMVLPLIVNATPTLLAALPLVGGYRTILRNREDRCMADSD